tara:strand:+ start:554 stop:985 length:432 start_codon:yes stop_codon:yes gene_type:complete
MINSYKKDLVKNLDKHNKDAPFINYDMNGFKRDVKRYVKATEQKRLISIIRSVSKSGMSRIIDIHEMKKSSYNGNHYIRNFENMFNVLGYKYLPGQRGYRINGVGMDMNYHTHYSVIYNMAHLDMIRGKNRIGNLAQMPPVII